MYIYGYRFGDGFVISSELFGNHVEISNIGKGAIFVSDTGGDKGVVSNEDRTIIGTIGTNTITCSVQVLNPSTDVSAYDISPLSYEVFGKKDCATGAFGPTSFLAHSLDERVFLPNQESIPAPISFNDIFISVRAPLTQLSGDRLGCGGKKGGGGYKADRVIEKSFGMILLYPVISLIEDIIWTVNTVSSFLWGYLPWQQGEDSIINNEQVHQQLVLVDRGECLFEEKAQTAESRGALGTLVFNTDETLFVMAGASVPTLANSETHILRSNVHHDKETAIPTVMMRKSDGEMLESAIRHLNSKLPTTVHTELQISSIPMILDSAYCGNPKLPKVNGND